MNKEDLIKARLITQRLLCKAIKEFSLSIFLLLASGLLASYFTPHVMDKIGFLVTLLFGLTCGIWIGVLRAYNIFWEKTEFKEASK